MREFPVALALGLVFGLGLAMGGMTNPQKVLALLDISGDWDPSLILLMGTAVTVTFALYRVAHYRKTPVFCRRFSWLAMTRIDMPVIVGPAIFGVGWGIGGVCPGPGLELIAANPSAAIWFVPAIFAGFWLGRPHHRQARRKARAEEILHEAVTPPKRAFVKPHI